MGFLQNLKVLLCEKPWGNKKQITKKKKKVIDWEKLLATHIPDA